MAWVMFKVASIERIIQSQKGLLYMNSLAYFSGLEEDGRAVLRGDPLEKTYQKFQAGPSGKYIHKIFLELGDGENRKIIDTGEKAVLSVEVPSPNNTMIFCMSALADDDTGKVPGEIDGKIHFDKRLLHFGSNMSVINNAIEFINRIRNAISSNKSIFVSPLFQVGIGLVQYLDLDGKSCHIGLFRKDKKYEWQHEFRICFGVKNDALNNIGAFEFQIEDISDIS